MYMYYIIFLVSTGVYATARIIVLAESHERCSIVGTSRIMLINTEASANDLTWLRIV